MGSQHPSSRLASAHDRARSSSAHTTQHQESLRISRRGALGVMGGAGTAALLRPTGGLGGQATPTHGQATPAGGQATPATRSPVVVQLGEPRLVEPGDLPLLGFNAQNSTSPFGYAEPNGRAATAELTPALLRFPGGSVANWYDWENDRYFDLPPELDEQYKNPQRWQKNLDEDPVRNGQVGFDDFISLAREVGAEPVLVVNLYYPFDLTPDDLAERAAAWLRHVNAERGLGVKYWELGNEYNLRAYVDRYADPSDPEGRRRDPAAYVEVGQKTAASMRAVDPSITLLAAGTSPGGMNPSAGAAEAPEEAQDSGQASWNKTLAAADFYDSVVMHTYAISTDSQYAEVPEGEPGAVTGDFAAEARWLFSVSQEQPRLADDYVRTTFGEEATVWNTEWAIHVGGVVDTFLGALYDADWVLHTADYPETFRALLRHNLTNPGIFYLYGYCRESGEPWNEQIDRSVSYYVFAQLDEAINQAAAVVPVELQNVPTFAGRFQYADTEVEGLTVRAWQMPDGTTRVAIVNKLGEAQTLQFAGDGGAAEGNASQFLLTGPLDAINSCNQEAEPTASPDTVVPTVGPVAREARSLRVEVPAYAFSVVTIEAESGR